MQSFAPPQPPLRSLLAASTGLLLSVEAVFIDERLDDMTRRDEPTFTIRAQDKFMPDVLEFWATEVERAVSRRISTVADMSREKVKEARALAHTVRAWQAMNYTKIPD